MREVRFLAVARFELFAAVAYYNRQGPELGARLIAEVGFAMDRAQLFPDAGHPGVAGTRTVHLPRFPFSVVYRRHRQGIEVVAIAHQSRWPGYWLSRVQEVFTRHRPPLALT